ncbi:MAG: PilZ domain-containing protein [Desulfobacteraceae bacterium]|nr:PilZ domain-containing protein [Desulfobacteraceae bacterium]
MTKEEKRKHLRIDSMHLLSYFYYDNDEDEATQGMGRTLNVSESGILLETHNPIGNAKNIRITIGFDEDMVEIKGHVVYTKQNADGKNESGIEFFEMAENAKKTLKQYIVIFNTEPK